MDYITNYYDYQKYVKSLVYKKNRPNNFKEWQIWKKRGDKRYFEFHHIIPKCFGGSDTEENLIPLTAREHILAHYLLTKIYNKRQKYQMLCALQRLILGYINREDIKQKDFGLKCLKSKMYSRLIEERNKLQSISQTGKKMSKAFCEKQKHIQNNRSEEWKKNISLSKIGEKNGMHGKKWYTNADETKSGVFQECPKGWHLGMLANKGNIPTNTKKVKCIETGIIYESLHAAARATDMNPTRICEMCNGKIKNSRKNNLHWEYA